MTGNYVVQYKLNSREPEVLLQVILDLVEEHIDTEENSAITAKLVGAQRNARVRANALRELHERISLIVFPAK